MSACTDNTYSKLESHSVLNFEVLCSELKKCLFSVLGRLEKQQQFMKSDWDLIEWIPQIARSESNGSHCQISDLVFVLLVMTCSKIRE
jgi:hypothetical protein